MCGISWRVIVAEMNQHSIAIVTCGTTFFYMFLSNCCIFAVCYLLACCNWQSFLKLVHQKKHVYMCIFHACMKAPMPGFSALDVQGVSSLHSFTPSSFSLCVYSKHTAGKNQCMRWGVWMQCVHVETVSISTIIATLDLVPLILDPVLSIHKHKADFDPMQ